MQQLLFAQTMGFNKGCLLSVDNLYVLPIPILQTAGIVAMPVPLECSSFDWLVLRTRLPISLFIDR